jgi:hypothetical protein
MPTQPIHVRSATLRWAIGMTLSLPTLVISGCGEDEIRHYKALRLEQPKPPARAAVQGDRRLLAAIIPHGERTWFFKLMGPSAAVAEHVETFEQFVRSIRFGGDRGITWDTPSNWKEMPGSESRFATLRLNSDPPLELTVVPLGREAGSLVDNLNRWRQQIGLDPIRASEVGQMTKSLQLDGAEATLVDMVSAGPSLPAGHPPVGPAAGRASPERPPLKYNVPDGWKEVPSQSAFRVASFEVVVDDQRADVSVSPLTGSAGGLAANVNRWRDQLGLPPVDAPALRDSLQQIDVAGAPAQLVHLVAPESQPNRQAILGAVLQRGDQTWFFKMSGPADLVASQRAAFESFVRSVQFE